MAAHQVTCVTKKDRLNSHEHITHIGYDGKTITREKAIQLIDSKEEEFYTLDRFGRRVPVHVRRDLGKAAYLQTKADGQWSDNLLALTECSLKAA